MASAQFELGETRRESFGMSFRNTLASFTQNKVNQKERPWFPIEPTYSRKIYSLFAYSENSIVGWIISVIILVVILISVITFILETLPQFRYPNVGDKEGDSLDIFNQIEVICVITFTIEYCAKLFTCTSQTFVELGAPKPHRSEDMDYDSIISDVSPGLSGTAEPLDATHVAVVSPTRVTAFRQCSTYSAQDELEQYGRYVTLKKVARFCLDPLNIVDFCAIAPFYISLITGSNSAGFAIVRVLRVTRIVRIFKLGKYSEGLQIFTAVMRDSVPKLLQLLFFISIIVVLFGSLIYFTEQGKWNAKEEIFQRPNLTGGTEESPFKSIPDGFWWVFTTATTVGYGDLYPTTPAGRVIAILTMLIGILVMALPITVIGTSFSTYMIHLENRQKTEDLQIKSKTNDLAKRRGRQLQRVDKLTDHLSDLLGQMSELRNDLQKQLEFEASRLPTYNPRRRMKSVSVDKMPAVSVHMPNKTDLKTVWDVRKSEAVDGIESKQVEQSSSTRTIPKRTMSDLQNIGVGEKD